MQLKFYQIQNSLMETFDFEHYTLVGYVDIQSSSNAYIEPLGYVNIHNNLRIISPKEKKKMFPPKGRVFAHNFSQRYNMLDKHLVCLAVIPNKKEGEDYDAYVWDKSCDVYEFGDCVYPIKDSVNDDGENNFKIFQENDLIEIEEDKYVLSGNKVLYIKATSNERLIPYWNASNINMFETFSGKKYLSAFQLPDRDGVIDITNDDQLINWFVTKILKKHWAEIVTADSYKSVEQYLFTAFNDMKHLTPNVYKSRLERLKKLNANFTMTLEELTEIAEIPWVKNVIEKTVDAYKGNLISDISAQYKHELGKIKEEHDKLLEREKNRYEEEIKQQKERHASFLQFLAEEEKKKADILDDKKLEIAILDDTIASKKDEIDQISELATRANKKKEDLLSDFAIIRDVLRLGSQKESTQVVDNTTCIRPKLNIQTLNMVDSECLMFASFAKALEDMLKLNKLPHQKASTIAESLAVYKMLLVPNTAYAMSIVHATQKCYYAVEYVSVSWKSFDDLWQGGLCDMVNHSKQELGVMHYLVLQNINLTYLPNYIQPLIDIQMGMTNCLPSSEEWPENIRILCTITKEEVIPMNEQCVKYMGCIEKPSKETYIGSFKVQYDARYGYLSPSKLSEKSLAIPANFYKMYINE